MEKFVIIGGMPRSGTNLARRIIGSHSQIALPATEFNFFEKYIRAKGVKAILEDTRVQKWGLDLSDLHSSKPSEAYIQALLRYAEKCEKSIPGEKTPGNEFFFDLLEEWFEGYELRFVHLVRNPLEGAASFKHASFQGVQRGGKSYSVVRTYAENWRRSVSIGLARSYGSPGTYYLLKYEDVVADPAGTIRDLCGFLGVEFEQERMLGLIDFSQYKPNTSFPQEEGETNPAYGRIFQPHSRRKYLEGTEIAAICDVCGELAGALGYEDGGFKVEPPKNYPASLKGKLRDLAGRIRRAARR